MENTSSSLPDVGYIRVKEILRYIPVSKSTWWAGVKEGRYPQPVKLGPRMTAWRIQDIRNYIQNVDSVKTINQ